MPCHYGLGNHPAFPPPAQSLNHRRFPHRVHSLENHKSWRRDRFSPSPVGFLWKPLGKSFLHKGSLGGDEKLGRKSFLPFGGSLLFSIPWGSGECTPSCEGKSPPSRGNAPVQERVRAIPSLPSLTPPLCSPSQTSALSPLITALRLPLPAFSEPLYHP